VTEASRGLDTGLAWRFTGLAATGRLASKQPIVFNSFIAVEAMPLLLRETTGRQFDPRFI
jgi:hypothetical protein